MDSCFFFYYSQYMKYESGLINNYWCICAKWCNYYSIQQCCKWFLKWSSGLKIWLVVTLIDFDLATKTVSDNFIWIYDKNICLPSATHVLLINKKNLDKK